MILLAFSLLGALVSGEQCNTDGSNNELLSSLSKDLLQSLEGQVGLPNPSVHIALRLSHQHNLAKESAHLHRLTSDLHNHIQSSLSQPSHGPGLMALYVLALKSSCYDLSTVTFTVNDQSDTLLNHLKKVMHKEKEEISVSHRPSTNYYQYSLGVLALCVGGVRLDHHVRNKLIKAVEEGHLKHGSVDTYAMAGMALQCVKNSGAHVQELNTALSTVHQKLVSARRPDGHIGNEFSTGLAVQALLAMGHEESECATSMEVMRTDARNNSYHNPMAISQILPALHQSSYLAIKNKQCLGEDNSLVLGPTDPEIELPSRPKTSVSLTVVNSGGVETAYSVDVPQGSSLLDTLEKLSRENPGFTFEKEMSLWGPYLSVVNGEQARQTDRRYWKLSAEGAALSQGMGDYKIESQQKIVIQNISY